MRKHIPGFAVAVALCTPTMTTADAKAADSHASHWVGGHSRTYRHSVFSHGFRRHPFAPNLIFGTGAAAGGLVTTIAADGLISTGTLPTAATSSVAVNDQGNSLSVAALAEIE
jgi:hypothetical protein